MACARRPIPKYHTDILWIRIFLFIFPTDSKHALTRVLHKHYRLAYCLLKFALLTTSVLTLFCSKEISKGWKKYSICLFKFSLLTVKIIHDEKDFLTFYP